MRNRPFDVPRLSLVEGFEAAARNLSFTRAAAELFGGDLGIAFLGSQGDPWDAQKDMAMAGIGAAIAMWVTLKINQHWQRDFNREWAESLRVKDPLPLDEFAFDRAS